MPTDWTADEELLPICDREVEFFGRTLRASRPVLLTLGGRPIVARLVLDEASEPFWLELPSWQALAVIWPTICE